MTADPDYEPDTDNEPYSNEPAPEGIAEDEQAYPADQPAPLWRSALEMVGIIAAAFVLAWLIRSFIVQPYVVPSESMVPTIKIHDRILAEKLTYRFSRQPKVGDIVVFDDPSGSGDTFVKRVIAVAGQTVDVRDGAVWVDGRRLDEPYTYGAPNLPGTVPLPVLVPRGQVWLMGDNRMHSGDARFFGPRPVSTVHGRAVWTYWPPSRFGPLS